MCLLQGPPFGFAVELVVGFRSLDPIGSGWLRVPITGLGLKVDALQRSRIGGLSVVCGNLTKTTFQRTTSCSECIVDVSSTTGY